MSVNPHYWTTADASVNLINLFDYLHYQRIDQKDTYVLYQKESVSYVVIYTEEGFWYYRCENPEEKLRASDLIRSFCSMIVTRSQKSIWEKLSNKYEEYLSSGADDAVTHPLTKVAFDFNHFEILASPVEVTRLESLYQEALALPLFQDSMFMNTEGEVLFPLYSTPNSICGYLKDTVEGMVPYPAYAHINSGIWYTALPNKIENLMLFSDPKEAISFYVQFQPKHTVCIAFPEINHSISALVMNLKKVSKAKKMFISFSGTTVLKSYLRDLHFIAQHQFNLRFNPGVSNVELILRHPEDDKFVKFYKKTNEFNSNIAAMYKKHNHTRTLNQTLVLKNSIVLKRLDSEMIQCRVPMEVNAITFMVWAYYKFFMPSDMTVLKPKETSWYRQYLKHEEVVDYKSFKLAV